MSDASSESHGRRGSNLAPLSETLAQQTLEMGPRCPNHQLTFRSHTGAHASVISRPGQIGGSPQEGCPLDLDIESRRL